MSLQLSHQSVVLRRSKRIQGRKVVERIIKKGESKETPVFVMKTMQNELDRNRYAIVISSKIEKSAVKRNQKRRQIYESIRQLEQKEMVPSSPSYDRVLLARRSLMTLSFDEIKSALKELLNEKI